MTKLGDLADRMSTGESYITWKRLILPRHNKKSLKIYEKEDAFKGKVCFKILTSFYIPHFEEM